MLRVILGPGEMGWDWGRRSRLFAHVAGVEDVEDGLVMESLIGKNRCAGESKWRWRREGASREFGYCVSRKTLFGICPPF